LAQKIHIDRAARILRAGGIVAYPTEAVFGLGCLPAERDAVSRLLKIKRRSVRKGFVVIAAELADLEPLVELPRGPMRREVLATWPGPVTWALTARRGVPAWLTGGRGTLAVRVTSHPIARALCLAVGGAVISTSANVSRRRPHTRLLRLRRDLGRQIDYVLAGDLGAEPRPTTIRDGVSGRVLRPS
jgi:L-threonylcarbamoyladenylate synthase